MLRVLVKVSFHSNCLLTQTNYILFVLTELLVNINGGGNANGVGLIKRKKGRKPKNMNDVLNGGALGGGMAPQGHSPSGQGKRKSRESKFCCFVLLKHIC